MSDDVKGTDTPTDAELASMSREELVRLGAKMDGVETIFKEERWPVAGTKAEKRAERAVAYWLLLGGLSGLALLLIFVFWPWEYKGGETPGHWWYDLATPLYGLTFGLSILAIGIGAVLFQKKFIPEEISIQDRHDGRSPELHRKTIAANLTDALESSTIKRRKLIGLSLASVSARSDSARWSPSWAG
jgi:ubiquinol-cytochrome c reductase iron-sulfur subunit